MGHEPFHKLGKFGGLKVFGEHIRDVGGCWLPLHFDGFCLYEFSDFEEVPLDVLHPVMQRSRPRRMPVRSEELGRLGQLLAGGDCAPT